MAYVTGTLDRPTSNGLKNQPRHYDLDVPDPESLAPVEYLDAFADELLHSLKIPANVRFAVRMSTSEERQALRRFMEICSGVAPWELSQ